MIAWYWTPIAALVAFVLAWAWSADANAPRLRPLEKGEKVMVPMDEGDAIALGEGIRWTFGSPRECARLEALRDRYRDAKYNATVEVAE